MPPLTRQLSRMSIFSWWSDRNAGPTINLHQFAKPLLRFLHHRQALAIIKRNRGSPLSVATLEIYSSYLPWDFVSWSTKAAILSEIADQTLSSEVDAIAVVDSPVFPFLPQMLEADDPGVKSASWRLIGNLAVHESIVSTILGLQVCGKLVLLLRHQDSRVVWAATHALSRLARWLDGAKSIVDAQAFHCVLELLASANPEARKRTCELVGTLASHAATAPVILELQVSVQLMCLLHDADPVVVGAAAYALSEIAPWLDKEKVSVDAETLGRILELLRSPNSDVRRWTCRLVGRFAQYGLVASERQQLNLCSQLVLLLTDSNATVVRIATFALSQIAAFAAGADAIINAGALCYIPELLESTNPRLGMWACTLITNLARHTPNASALLELDHSITHKLATFLRNHDNETRDASSFALDIVIDWLDEASAPTAMDEGLHSILHPNILDEGRGVVSWVFLFAWLGHLTHRPCPSFSSGLTP
ncbi:armadillo-type protein [Favolaschia claudopus]|uniref:Armadillo-type protein n=1 Tax=Favolaschia claudopus TaxID=2862362 RepID=A0AAW0BX11_9AGAR